ARQRKAEKCVKEFATVSRVIHLLETKFRVTLRTVAKLLHFAARQRKAEKCVKEFATVSCVVHLLLHSEQLRFTTLSLQ
ncbi:hypothetical protein SAMN02745116_00722, partial [Pilibacter termitis]